MMVGDSYYWCLSVRLLEYSHTVYQHHSTWLLFPTQNFIIQPEVPSATLSKFQVLAWNLQPEFHTMIAACPRALTSAAEPGQQNRELQSNLRRGVSGRVQGSRWDRSTSSWLCNADILFPCQWTDFGCCRYFSIGFVLHSVFYIKVYGKWHLFSPREGPGHVANQL